MSVAVVGAALAVAALLCVVSTYILIRQPAADSINPSRKPDWASGCNSLKLSTNAALRAAPDDWKSVIEGSLLAAEERLDRVEAGGYAERELIVLGNESFLVRWR